MTLNKGISFYFGYDVPKEKRAEMIKNAGFDCVITNADKKFDSQNGSIKQQVKLFKKYGLKCSSLHFQYNGKELFNFFLHNKIGDRMEKMLIKDIKTAHKYGFICVVVHLFGKMQNIDVCMERLDRVLKVAERYNVPIAVENIGENKVIHYVFKNIQSKYLKFCFDSGHQHRYFPNEDYLKLYGDRLICVHLHDNMGDKDAHTLNMYGNIDWDHLAKQLAKCPDVNLDYELLFVKKCKLSSEEALKICHNQAVELESLINKYRKHNKTKTISTKK